eukprot:gene5037-14651_t
MPYGTKVQLRRILRNEEGHWGELEDGGWVPAFMPPHPIQTIGMAHHYDWRAGDGETLRFTIQWRRPAWRDGLGVDRRPEYDVAPGAPEPLLLRDTHHWCIKEHEGKRVWAAADAPEVPGSRILEIPAKPEAVKGKGTLRQRLELPLVHRGAFFVGTVDEEGRLRACPARRFFRALEGWASAGREVPLTPTSAWLDELTMDDQSSVWDLSSNDALRRMVPPCGGPADAVAAVLEFILDDVIRRPPFVPEDVWPPGMTPPELAYVEYGDGWAPLQRPFPPREGNELIVRHRGGQDWCSIAEKSHGFGLFHAHKTWFVLGGAGLQQVCSHPSCVAAARHGEHLRSIRIDRAAIDPTAPLAEGGAAGEQK